MGQVIIGNYIISEIEDRDKIVILMDTTDGSTLSQISDQEEYIRFTTNEIEKNLPYDDTDIRKIIEFEKGKLEVHLDNDHHLNIYVPDGAEWEEVQEKDRKGLLPTIVATGLVEDDDMTYSIELK